ncbi:MAG: aminotransferase class I/II-fold pyridoxal phosphate-dependent enzyme, partial [Stellaceae bacterium]
ELGALGLAVTPSAANFVLARFDAMPKDSEAAFAFLHSQGILVRKMTAYGLSEHLRITIGLEEEMRAVVAALAAFLRAS